MAQSALSSRGWPEPLMRLALFFAIEKQLQNPPRSRAIHPYSTGDALLCCGFLFRSLNCKAMNNQTLINQTNPGSLRRRIGSGGVAFLFMLVSATAFAHQSITSSGLSFSDANPMDGDTVTITGTLTYTGGTNGACPPASPGCPHSVPAANDPVVDQTLKLQIRQSDTSAGFDPSLGVACDVAGEYFTFASGPTDGSGQFSAPFDTTGLGDVTICFRSQHTPEGDASHKTSQSHSAGIPLDIDVGDCSGVTLTHPEISGGTVNANGSVRGPWILAMDVTNCLGSQVMFKVQGGANAWAPLNPGWWVSAGSVEPQPKKKNTVLTWNVSIADGNTETIVFSVGTSSSVVACGELTEYLSGAWSAAYTDPETGLPAKSPYTNRATVTSLACP